MHGVTLPKARAGGNDAWGDRGFGEGEKSWRKHLEQRWLAARTKENAMLEKKSYQTILT
jgi:hypothetical protein